MVEIDKMTQIMRFKQFKHFKEEDKLIDGKLNCLVMIYYPIMYLVAQFQKIKTEIPVR